MSSEAFVKTAAFSLFREARAELKSMAKKRKDADRDVLKFKLQILHDYISHHERKLNQFLIDLVKSV